MSQFTVGHYKTIDGLAVEIVKTNGRAPYPLIGYVEDDEGDGPAAWTAEGKYWEHGDSGYDLVPATPAPATDDTIQPGDVVELAVDSPNFVVTDIECGVATIVRYDYGKQEVVEVEVGVEALVKVEDDEDEVE